MKNFLYSLCIMLLLPAVASAQETQKINKKILDHVTTYSPDGKKVEEIEYGEKGQKWRKRYEYDENGKMSREIVYDENNALVNYSTALMLPLHCLTCNRSRYNSECCKYTYSTTRISIVMRRYIECYQLLFWLALIKVVKNVEKGTVHNSTSKQKSLLIPSRPNQPVPYMQNGNRTYNTMNFATI